MSNSERLSQTAASIGGGVITSEENADNVLAGYDTPAKEEAF